jgi:hypothetical protein
MAREFISRLRKRRAHAKYIPEALEARAYSRRLTARVTRALPELDKVGVFQEAVKPPIQAVLG